MKNTQTKATLKPYDVAYSIALVGRICVNAFNEDDAQALVESEVYVTKVRHINKLIRASSRIVPDVVVTCIKKIKQTA